MNPKQLNSKSVLLRTYVLNKGKDLVLGKKAPLVSKTVTLPTEAKIRQAEIMKKARTTLEPEQQALPPSMPDLSVQIEDIGPEQDIFDQVVNNLVYNTTEHVDVGAETEGEGGQDPVPDTVPHTSDSFVNVDYLPGPSNPGPSNPGPSFVHPAEQNERES